MALTTEQINEMFRDAKRREDAGFVDYAHQHFAHAIEAEVRKQDEELIRELVEALEPFAYEKPAREAIAAGRARLEGKP